ncbi:MAG TPA: hypothetical protein VFZ69_01865 [Longimicrobiales bacterium]
MKRNTKPKTNRWTDRPRTREKAAAYPETPGPARESARPRVRETGMGPYEATYDVSHGYGHERAIILP